jgi:pilus assembly protein CpaB
MALKLPSIPVNKNWLMLGVAILLALLAAFLTTQYLRSREQSIAAQLAARAQQGGPKVSVVVPVRDLQIGTPLDSALVAARDVQTDLLYPDAIKVDEFDKFKGQSLIRPVYRGRPLLKTDLRPLYADFAGSLAPGTRAMTIDIDELNSISHMVQPGNRVDLMLAMKRDDGGQTVVPFMDQMKVLATGQKIYSDAGDDKAPGGRRGLAYSNVTLEVTPVQAARLALAQDIGKLRIVLRNETDTQNADYSVNAQNILDEVTERSRRQQQGRKLAAGSVEFIIGGARSGPTAKSIDVAAPGAGIPPGMVPYMVPGPAPRGAAPAAPGAGSAAPAAAPGPSSMGGNDYGAPATSGSVPMTSEVRDALKDLVNKPQ